MKTRFTLSLIVISMATLLLSAPVSAGGTVTDSERTATLDGKAIDLAEVSKYRCNDLAFPTIRCFTTEKAALADVAEITDFAAAGLSPRAAGFDAGVQALGITYCIWYWDGGYSGAAFWQGYNAPKLGDMGWNDAISSFKQLNNHRCRWYMDSNYTGIYWMWPAGFDASYVGDGPNDQFSSVFILQ